MQGRALALLPGGLDHRGVGQVVDLLNDVELDHPAEHLLAGEALQLRLVKAVDVLDVKQPLVGDHHPRVLPAQCGLDAAASVVAADDDVVHLQHRDRVLENAEAVEVGGDDLVGDVAVDEDLAGLRVDDRLCRHAAVGASDPEELGVLFLGEIVEILGIVAEDFLRPSLVLKEQSGGQGGGVVGHGFFWERVVIIQFSAATTENSPCREARSPLINPALINPSPRAHDPRIPRDVTRLPCRARRRGRSPRAARRGCPARRSGPFP